MSSIVAAEPVCSLVDMQHAIRFAVHLRPPSKIFLQGEDGAATAHVTRHSKGCSCRKSNCLKKYCECFQAGICCASTCRCKDCRNYDGSEQLLAVMRREDVDTTTRHAQGVRLSSPAPAEADLQLSQPWHHALMYMVFLSLCCDTISAQRLCMVILCLIKHSSCRCLMENGREMVLGLVPQFQDHTSTML